MKNNKTFIATLALGAIAAGAAAYLFLTEDGAELREELVNQFRKFKASLGGTAQEEPEAETVPAYLQHHQKAPKTDRDALMHGELLHEQPHE